MIQTFFYAFGLNSGESILLFQTFTFSNIIISYKSVKYKKGLKKTHLPMYGKGKYKLHNLFII